MAQIPTHRPQDKAPPPSGEVVELRVHGVGGASPEELLDVPLTELVAGDESAGFFRPWLPHPQEGPALEGYSWGGLTSASRWRSLWVLLTPFALVNLAGWMLRHGGEATDLRPRRRTAMESAAVAVVRLFGLVLTMAVTGFLAVGGIDLLASQCGTDAACTAGRWWLGPWETASVRGHPGRAGVVGAAVPLTVAMGLAWLARRSQLAIHQRKEVRYTARGDPALRVNLNQPRLWESPDVAHRLGLTHTAAAVATVGVTLAAAAPGGMSLELAGWLVLAASAAATLRLEGVGPSIHWGLLVIAVAHLLAVAVGIWLGSPWPATEGPLPGADAVLAQLLAVYPALLAAATVVSLLLWRGNGEGRLRVALVAPALLLGGAGLVNAFGSGLTIRLADLLGTPEAATDAGTSAVADGVVIFYSGAIADTAIVTVWTLMVAGVALGVAWLRAGPGPSCVELEERYVARGGLDCRDPDDRAWASRVARAEAVAALADHMAGVVAAVAFVVVTSVGMVAVLAGDGQGLGLGEATQPLAGPASWILGLIPLLAVYGISRLYRSRALRRLVGVVWDVVTFWPRWFHPWTPPSYGERAVGQLSDRLWTLTGRGGVVLSGHSQGSVLAVSTLLLAEGRVTERTALLTHGSPLTRLYATYFPEYFSTSLHARLAAELGGWINLWRRTDFIGGPLATAGVADRPVLDPVGTRPPTRGEPRPAPLRHSDYDRTVEYRQARDELAAGVSTDGHQH